MKKRIIRLGLVLFIIPLLITFGLALWIIPSSQNVDANENLNGLWEKYLGGQSVVYNDGYQKPTSSNTAIVNPSGYSISSKLVGDTDFISSPYGVIDVGNYILKYDNGTNSYEVTFSILPANNTNVCFIPGTLGTSSTYSYYTTIEAALEAATSGQSVYVIPGTNPTIWSTCEIKYGVSLCLPYANPVGTGLSSYCEDNAKLCTILHVSGETTTFYPAHTDSTLLTNEVKIADGVTLKNNGTIIIGGNINAGFCWNYSGLNGNYGYTDINDTDNTDTITGSDGVTNGTPFKGYYSQITLGKNSKIESTGYIECNGYIVGDYTTTSTGEIIHNSQVHVKEGSIRMPFITPENRQGTRFAIMAGGILKYAGAALGSQIDLSFSCTPFNRFYVQNVATNLRVEYKGSMLGYCNLYANNQVNSTIIKMVSTDSTSLFQLTNETYSYFECSTTLNYDKNKDYGANQLKFNIYGGAQLNDLTMSITADFPVVGVKTVNVSTDGTFFPFSWYYNINLFVNEEKQQSNASFVFNSDVKLMPGASLKVNEGVTLTCQQLAVYESFNEASLTGFVSYYDLGIKDGYPQDKGAAKLIVNGKINTNQTGGLYLTENTNAYANITTASLTSPEWAYVSNNGEYSATNSGASTVNISLNLKMYMYDSKVLEAREAGVYYSKEGYWDTDSGINIFTISYNNNGKGDSLLSKVITQLPSYYELTIEDLPILFEHHYEFIGWFDSSGNQYFVGDVISSSIELIAHWQAITYNINYVIGADAGITIPNVTNSNPTTFNVDTLPTLVDLIDSNYVINGWFLDSDYSGTKLSSLTLDNLEYLNDNVITLYTKWMEPVLKTYSVTLIVTDKAGSPINTITINDLTASKTGIAYLNPYDGYGLSYTANDINDSSIKKYLDNWYFADYSSGEPKFTYNDSFKCGLSDDGKIILDGDDGASFIIYVKELSKYSVTYGEESEFYVSTFTTRSLTNTANAVYRWMDESGNIYKANASVTLTGNITLTSKTFHKVSISATNATVVVSTTGNCILTSTDGNPTSTTSSLSNDAIIYVLDGTTITTTPTYTQSNSQTCTVSPNEKIEAVSTITVSSKSGTCLISGTLVTMADGSKKKVEELCNGDQVLVFNHITGQYEISFILYDVHEGIEWNYYSILNLEFNDGTTLRIHNDHYLYDVDLRQYVLINEDNYLEYIGHRFFANSFDENNNETRIITLLNGHITYEYVGIYGHITAYHLNLFANDLLTIPGDNDPFINIFEMDENYKYDEELMKLDIEKYGLMDYSELADYIPYEIFEYYHGEYLNVAIGKGYTTKERVIELIKKYLSNYN